MAILTTKSDPFKLVWPFTLLISGPSGSGKSTLVHEMIKQPDCMDKTPKNIVIAYSQMQQLYSDIARSTNIPVKFIKGIPAESQIQSGSLLIIDDLLGVDSKSIAAWFTVLSHHKNTSVIYLVQNIFFKNPEHRTASLNTHYLAILKNPRDHSQILHLARQFAPRNVQFVLSAFEQATSRPHGYLVLNFKQSTPDLLRVKDSLFKDACFYVDKNIGQPYSLSSAD